MSYGMKGHVGICFQQSFGTAFTSSMHYFPIINETLTENIPPLLSEGLRGRFDEGPSFEGPHDIGGDIVAEAHPILMGVLLKAWCGYSSGTIQGSCYSHEFKPRTTDFDDMAAVPPMTIEVYRDAGSAHQYYDCLCNALNIENAHGTIVKVTAGLIGGNFAKAVKTVPSYLTGSEFTWNQTSISFQGSAGGAIDEVSQITIAMNNNLEGKGTLDNTKTFNRIKRGGFRTIEVSGTILFVDDDEFDQWRNQAAQPAVMTVTGQEISSGYNAEFKADFPEMRYNEFPVNIGGPGMIEVGFGAAAKYNADSATMAEFTLVNTQAAY